MKVFPVTTVLRCARTAALTCAAALAVAVPTCAAAADVLRDQHDVVVDGVRETWRLVWDGEPGTFCAPDDADATTCPCSGFAYGEYGRLVLVRSRDGRDVERMDLRPLFGSADYPEAAKLDGSAFLQRWLPQDGDVDRRLASDPHLVADVAHRQPTTILHVADYNRDGAATEFLVQVGTLPCGKRQFLAIGLSGATRRLHALASAAHPDTPLIMPRDAWQALLKGAGPAAVETVACGDHGSETRQELVVAATAGSIHVTTRDYSCPTDGGAAKLLNETPG